MSEVTKKNLVLTFKTQAGKDVSLTINSPKKELEAATVKTAMEAIVNAKAYGKGTAVQTASSAKYVMQEVETISLA